MKRISDLTQEKAVFYVLWKSHRDDPDAYVPAWRFVGEIDIIELGKTFFLSYKAPANGINVFFKNPGLIERRQTTGKSGAKYYEYRIAPNPSVEKIKDPVILNFYKLIKNSPLTNK